MPSTLTVVPDELVTLSLDGRHLLLGALLLHGLPWAGLLAGAVAGVLGIGGDLGALIGALAGLAGGSLLVRRHQLRWQGTPVLTRPCGTSR